MGGVSGLLLLSFDGGSFFYGRVFRIPGTTIPFRNREID